MNYKAGIFDLDGTVLDTLEDLYVSVNFALGKNECPLRNIDEVRAFVGNGIRILIERSVPEGCAEETVNRVFDDFKDYYKEHSCDNTKPYEKVCEMLSLLKNSGIKTAVVSNKADFAVKRLVDTYFCGLFDFAVGEREGVKRKPAPDAVFEALKQLDVHVDNSVYIGDSEVDVKTSENAGIDCICVSWGFRTKQELINAGADEICDTVEELKLKLLK